MPGNALFRLVMLVHVAAALAATPAWAAETKIYTSGDQIDPAEVAAILGGVKTRSIRPRLNDDKDASLGRPSKVGVPIPFAFGSTSIPPATLPLLDRIAEGIKDAGSDVKVVIEGHTDAIGSDRYNVALSYRRANAVKQYLVDKHSVPGENLKTVGLGKSSPLDPRDPTASINRRVEFRAYAGE